MNRIVNEKEIRALIGRFMEGKTSLEEEELLGRWFAEHTDASEDLRPYAKMFAYINEGMPKEEDLLAEDESLAEQPLQKASPQETDNKTHPARVLPLWKTLSAAACLAALIAVAWWYRTAENVEKTNVISCGDVHKSEEIAEVKKDSTQTLSADTIIPSTTPSKSHRYRKDTFSPARPATYLAKVAKDNTDSIALDATEQQREAELLADRHLKAMEQEQNEMFFRLHLIETIQTMDVENYMASMNTDE